MYRRRSRVSLFVATAVTLSLSISACSNAGPGVSAVATTSTTKPLGFVAIRNGAITDEALTAIAPNGVPDAAALDGVMGQVNALPADQQLVVFQDASRRFELATAKVSGLQQAVGGEQATAAALDAAWAKVGKQIDALNPAAPLQPGIAPKGFARVAAAATGAPTTPGAVGVVGVFMGAMALAMFADPMVSSSDSIEPGNYGEYNSDGLSINSTTASVSAKMDFNGMQDDVNVHFKSGAVVYPCPTAAGDFAVDVNLDLKTSKGAAAQQIKITMKIRGQVDDNADLASKQTETNTQWQDSGGIDGTQALDFTSTRRDEGPSTWVANGASSTLTKTSVRLAGFVTGMFQAMIEDRMVKAAEKGWQSGRCVRLGAAPSVGPTGLRPGQTVSVLTTPRSKLDGTPTGGKVTATLASGGKSIDPAGTKVPADATFHYVAPDEAGKGGSVSFESRSKRGVGKATIDFGTKGAYTASGGTPVSFTGVVPDLAKQFTLQGTGPGFTVTFTFTPSSATAGTLEYRGSGAGVTIKGTGTYTIAGADPNPLTLHYNDQGCASPGGCRSNSNSITLTRT
ncbi:MAG: hypothetical protein WCI22_05725 [Actinomycetota bacterium]